METKISEIMQQSQAALSGKWGLAIGGSVLYFITAMAASAIPIIGAFAGLIIGGPFMLGLAYFFLAISRDEDARIEQIFDGFSDFKRAMVAYLLMVLKIFLWMLLLIVPGIIKAIAYSMTFYILADDDEIDAKEALEKSEQMMYGYKLKYFYLSLRFFVLSLLCILTLGIGYLWLMPYMHTTIAKFYEDIKDKPVAIEA